MDRSYSTLLQKVEQCLVQVKRQLFGIMILKSCVAGLTTSAIVLALYIVIWPRGGEKIAVLAKFMDEHSWASPYAILLPILGLWCALSIILSFISFFYLRSHDNKSRKLNSLSELSPTNFLLHLNRYHPSLEESAHLLASPDKSLSILQSLQLARITPSLAIIISSPNDTWLPKVSLPRVLLKGAYAITFSVVILTSAVMYLNNKENLAPSAIDTSIVSSAQVDVNYLDTILVRVDPPIYTKQASFEQSDLDISVLQGSKIQWLIPFKKEKRLNEDSAPTFTLVLSGKDPIDFVSSDSGFKASLSAKIGAVYSITQTSTTNNYTTDIATITVKTDIAPIVTFLTPKQTITEIPTNMLTSVTALVEISDDYGISDVKIVASIAKGSGEAVKFRDQEFFFDSMAIEEDKALYTKNWDLRALEMSPGDELYFSVHASDNKTPISQKTVSPIKIIRWLEDEEATVSGEGIVIDFMPEYFKSQQQIIIETEALIEQMPSLSTAELNVISRGLGVSQSDLKQSYGQYLGDEFESGIMQNMEAGPSMPDIDDHAGEHADEHNESEHASAGHEHEGEETHENDLSGYQQAIEQFGHNHGEADIGFIKITQGQINPKVLMKKAIAQMWQAELHLQLSEPNLALPYEKEALNYLNRAKQAERIYVKRLGFEPPPVTEERRYTGKLQDILSYKRESIVALTPSQNSQFVALIVLLNNYLTLPHNALKPSDKLSAEDGSLINDVAVHLSEKLSTEPEWISQLASLKRIQMANSLNIADCSNCLRSLIAALSSQLTTPVANIYAPSKMRSGNLPFVRAYSEALLEYENALNKSTDQLEQGTQP